MRALICGSRHWKDMKAIRTALQDLPKGTVIVHGGDKEMDMIVDREARALGMEVEIWHADRERFGRRAAALRDKEVVASGVDRLIVFRRNEVSLDVERLVLLSMRAGVEVVIHGEDGEHAGEVQLILPQHLDGEVETG